MLAPWKKSYDQPRQHIKKQRHYFSNKSPSSQSFELGCKESWAPKNWCFWTVVLGKTFESTWTARRSNQSILKEISPEYSLEGLNWSWNSNTLVTWFEELTYWKRLWCWEWLKVGGEGDSRGWDGWMASLTQWTWVWAGSRSWWWTGKPGVLQSMRSQEVGLEWVTELNGTELSAELDCFCLKVLLDLPLYKVDSIYLEDSQTAITQMVMWVAWPRLPCLLPLLSQFAGQSPLCLSEVDPSASSDFFFFWAGHFSWVSRKLGTQPSELWSDPMWPSFPKLVTVTFAKGSQALTTWLFKKKIIDLAALVVRSLHHVHGLSSCGTCALKLEQVQKKWKCPP